MKTETKLLGIILLATVVLLVGGIFFLSRKGSESSGSVQGTATVKIDYSKGQRIGSDSAKVRLVEFSDFQCPACLAAEPYIKKVINDYPTQVQFIYRHFPLPQHKNAKKAANLAEAAADQGKFWEMHDKIFQTQSQWAETSDSTAFFMDLAKQLQLDEDKVKQALDNSTFKSKIEDDLIEGQTLGVNSTPTFFLNGVKLNLKSFDDLNAVVAAEINK